MKTFKPIAIIGQGCILPGCKNPEELWDTVSTGRVNITYSLQRDWRTRISGHLDGSGLGKMVTDKGGYVYEDDCPLDSDIDKGLDPLFRWCVYAAKQALFDSGYNQSDDLRKTGFILGNLSFPSDSFSQLFENEMLAEKYPSNYEKINPLNRFVSGLPALFTKKALSLGGEAFSLDAACASSIYAVKLACDRLHNRSADMMLAGAVNAAEQLFLHMGFNSLKALSVSGESRPFSKEADGLLPAEGAAFLVLKRLEDAIRDGDHIDGIIRGIFCSNDGGSGGLLSPSLKDQIFCLTRAYELAGINPADVSYVECHATGTSTGDTIELKGLKEIFKHNSRLFLGSLKANFGHLITTSGAASFIKVLQSLKHKTISPTPNSQPFNSEIEDSIFVIPQTSVNWQQDDSSKPLIAGISNFGFGGNNAHAIIEEWNPPPSEKYPGVNLPAEKEKPKKVALIAVEVEINNVTSTAEFIKCLKDKDYLTIKINQIYEPEIHLDHRSLGFPPNDLRETLGQQLLVVKKAAEALSAVNHVDYLNTGVYIGMGTDVEVNRFGLNMRLKKMLRQYSPGISEQTLDDIEDKNDLPITAAASLGCMPNITANRVSNQFNLKGPGYTISCEELSGNKALECALLAIANGEIHTAIVGAVDLSMHPVHLKAATEVLGDRYSRGSNCVILYILKEYELALKDKEKVIATFEFPTSSSEKFVLPSPQYEQHIESVIQSLGIPFAAHGLLKLTSHLLLSQNPSTQIRISESFIGEESKVYFYQGKREPHYEMALFSGADKTDLLSHIKSLMVHDPIKHHEHISRLGFIYSSPQEYEQLLQKSITLLSVNDTDQTGWKEDIIFYSEQVPGDLAFAFTGAASAYKGMGRELLQLYPYLEKRLQEKWPTSDKVSDWIYHDTEENARQNLPFNQLCSSTFLSQIHAIWTRETLGIKPNAVLGLSSGETNSILAMGVWKDFEALFSEIFHSDLYQSQLSGEYKSVKQYWNLNENLSWDSVILLHPIKEVQEIIENYPKVFLCIINSPTSCVVGGEKNALKDFLKDLSNPLSVPLNHDLAIHCSVVKPFEQKWYDLHHRETHENEEVNFYSNVFGGVYKPTPDSVAEALTVQAIQTIDFPKIVEKAWDDGIRIFIEHGPKNSLSKFISEILKGKEHKTIALDQTDTCSAKQILLSSLELWAMGRNIDLTHLPLKKLPSMLHQFRMKFQLYKPPFYLPGPTCEVMKKPPVLAPVISLNKSESLSIPSGWDEKQKLILEIQQEQEKIHNLYLEKSKQSHIQYMSILQDILLKLTTQGTGTAIEKGLPGLKISREELEILASDKISKVLGPQFSVFDDYDLLVRMPMPPLLLCDRVTGIAATPLELSQGTIWTETDVKEDSWYLHHGHMPAGINIESGQSDLLLISYMGIDLHNAGKKAYRLLGCELQFEGGLPKPGDVLKFKISIDDHLKNGDVRLFLFHYDCYINGERRIKVRNAQAGFFSREELDHSDGCLWEPDEATYSTTPIDLNWEIMTHKRSFSHKDIQAYLRGDMVTCFGSHFFMTQTHTRTPQTPAGVQNFISEVVDFNPEGGPAKRGYLKSVSKISEDNWFFDGHFKNDPCMPGTLMADACLQMMSFYMVALGLTQEKDGWRFEPVTHTVLKLICRGQVIPDSDQLTYEIFIDEIIPGNEPIIFAHVLCTVDGLKAFCCERMGVKLVPGWPLSSNPSLLKQTGDPNAFKLDGFPLDYNSLIHGALGKPSDTFGPKLRHLDGSINTPKLPGPPYHFVTRIIDINAEMGQPENQSTVIAEYDIPESAWYFQENGRHTMPYCVLMEIALQPCGWLSSYTLPEAFLKKGLLYRNLDGDKAIQYREVTDEGKTIRTTTRLISFSQTGELIIEKFIVESRIDDELVYSFETAFGFFSKEAMKNQKGLPISEQEKININQPANVNIDLLSFPSKYFSKSSARLPASKLLMIDRITCFLPQGGRNKLGYVRAEKDVDSKDWFFKSHFYQDPVQPGSLGVEGVLQLLQWMMLEMGLHHPFRDPVFEPILLEEETTWRYRGQVIPFNKLISLDLDILEINDKGDTLFAHANLWVDSLKIYNLPRVGMRIKEAPELLSEKSRLSAGSWMKSRAIQSGLEDGLLLDMTGAFLDEFVEDLIFEDVRDFYSISGPAIYMANHQTAVESYLALAVIYGLKGGRLSAISKQENKELWIGKLLELGKHLLRDMPLDIIYFNRDKPEEFITIYKNYLNSARENNQSLLVHVSGTREMVEGALLERMSSVLIDIALEYDLPMVPLRLTNGLPPESHSKRWDFPFNNQKQTYIFGKQLNLKEMKTLRPTERTAIFLNQLNRMITQKSDNKFFAPPKSHKNPVLSPNIATLSPFGKVLLNSLLKFSNLSNEGHLFLEYYSGKSVQSQLKSKFQLILGVIQQ